jgi:hypothetical protein
MLSVKEGMPLPYLKWGVAGIAFGSVLFLGGLWILSAAPESWMLPSVVLMGIGIALAMVGIYYRGCANGSCTPADHR